jgi:hypothetical protein
VAVKGICYRMWAGALYDTSQGITSFCTVEEMVV